MIRATTIGSPASPPAEDVIKSSTCQGWLSLSVSIGTKLKRKIRMTKPRAIGVKIPFNMVLRSVLTSKAAMLAAITPNRDNIATVYIALPSPNVWYGHKDEYNAGTLEETPIRSPRTEPLPPAISIQRIISVWRLLFRMWNMTNPASIPDRKKVVMVRISNSALILAFSSSKQPWHKKAVLNELQCKFMLAKAHTNRIALPRRAMRSDCFEKSGDFNELSESGFVFMFSFPSERAENGYQAYISLHDSYRSLCSVWSA